MALNLVRNSRVFYTSNVDSAGNIKTNTGFTTANTQELQVLDGFTFTQNTTSETVTLNESGSSPKRGQRSFNTALEPAEVTMSTYIRPEKSTNVICEESVLWNALATGKTSSDGWTPGTSSSTLSFDGVSDAHQLKAFGLIIVVDNVTYLVNNCAVDQAVIDFGIDSLATIAWTIRGSTIKQATTTLSVDSNGVMTGLDLVTTAGATGYVEPANRTTVVKNTLAAYIANKLSTIKMYAGIGGTAGEIDIPVTGGSITFANNISYLTPANLGTVNQPITYFTGTRAVSGSLTGYLRTGGDNNNSGKILSDLLATSATNIDPKYRIVISIGGATNNNRVEVEIPGAVLTIPTVSVEQVVSTTINFTAQGTSGSSFDIEESNEATVKYYAVA